HRPDERYCPHGQGDLFFEGRHLRPSQPPGAQGDPSPVQRLFIPEFVKEAVMTPLLLMCQILGFLLQTSPVAFLFFLPFGSEELRLPLRATRLITLAAPLAASLGYVPL